MSAPNERLDLIASLLQTAVTSANAALRLLGEMRQEQQSAAEAEKPKLPPMAGRR